MKFDSSKFLDKIFLNKDKLEFYNLKKLGDFFNCDLKTLPFSYRILLENLIRNSSKSTNTYSECNDLINFRAGKEIFFYPGRVLMQDYTGVPAIADLASMRDKMKSINKDPELINPQVPVSLIIDHSITVDSSSKSNSQEINVEFEFSRNQERYQLLKWAQNSLKNFSLFPPGSGICHQINIEFLADIVSKKNNLLFIDTVVGTDSHTTMVNALSVLGWGVGGIEAEAVMLGQPISMKIPDVVGVKITGNLNDGLTATDVVLTITEKLRKLNVVGKFVEFFGPGLSALSLSERSTISNMAPEYGATCGLFPVDKETIKYMKLTRKDKHKIDIIETFCKKQKIWHDENFEKINYNEKIEIDLSKIEPCIAGPKRPQDRVNLSEVKKVFIKSLNKKITKKHSYNDHKLENGRVCLASITSCTNTSNPSVLIMSGLIARNAVKFGLKVPWWVKTSFAPGSRVVREYMKKAGLQKFLDQLGFNIVGYGCTTCIGNSGPLDNKVSKLIEQEDLNVCSVISGNRNFEGRIHPLIKSNFLASPPLVLIYALAGRIDINLDKEEIALVNGRKIFMKDLWPLDKDVHKLMDEVLEEDLFKKNYENIFSGNSNWKKIKTTKSSTYNWSLSSTYIKKPPFLEKKTEQKEILNARALLCLGDSITTDHISPAGVIKKNSEAGSYLLERQISENDFNSFGARRGNHEVMLRGTFANIRIKNFIVDKLGGFTKHFPSGEEGEIFKISEKYKNENVPLIVIAGKEYGTGSSRDWAAKGTKLLGVKAVIAESFERIHRSNLVGMGVIPLEIESRKLSDLNLDGSETFDIGNIQNLSSKPNLRTKIKIKKTKKIDEIKVISRIDTDKEVKYFRSGGILPYVFNLMENKKIN